MRRPVSGKLNGPRTFAELEDDELADSEDELLEQDELCDAELELLDTDSELDDEQLDTDSELELLDDDSELELLEELLLDAAPRSRLATCPEIVAEVVGLPVFTEN